MMMARVALVLLAFAGCDSPSEAQRRPARPAPQAADTLHRECRDRPCARGQTCYAYTERGRPGIRHSCEIRCDRAPCPTGLECRSSGDDRGRVCFAPEGRAGRAALEAASRTAASREDAEALLRLLENLPAAWSADQVLGSLTTHCSYSALCRPSERECLEVLGVCSTAPRDVCEYGVRESCASWAAGRTLLEAIRARYAELVRAARPSLTSDAERARLDAAWSATERRLR